MCSLFYTSDRPRCYGWVLFEIYMVDDSSANIWKVTRLDKKLSLDIMPIFSCCFLDSFENVCNLSCEVIAKMGYNLCCLRDEIEAVLFSGAMCSIASRLSTSETRSSASVRRPRCLGRCPTFFCRCACEEGWLFKAWIRWACSSTLFCQQTHAVLSTK